MILGPKHNTELSSWEQDKEKEIQAASKYDKILNITHHKISAR